MSALQSAASGSSSSIVLVEPGTYSGTLSVGSNKTIIGKGPGVTIQGNVSISGSSNVIMRNFTIRGNNCSTYDECRAGSDAVAVQDSAHHVWLDHLDIADGQDGNLDITKQADYITVSFSKFHYTYNKEHRFSNLISSSDDSFDDRNKLQITYMNSWWGERVNQRMPRGRFGKVHLLNDYFSSQDSGQIIHGPGVEVSYIIEGCYYEVPSGTQSIRANYGTVTSVVAKNNSGSASGMNQTLGGPEFSIPYSFTAIASSDVKALVTALAGGAGNTCTFAQ
jgi:pectate lyase